MLTDVDTQPFHAMMMNDSDRAAEAMKPAGSMIMKKYECTLCSYVYDPAVGDPDNGVDPGTAFEDLPDDWVCPDCGAGKEDFEPVD